MAYLFKTSWWWPKVCRGVLQWIVTQAHVTAYRPVTLKNLLSHQATNIVFKKAVLKYL